MSSDQAAPAAAVNDDVSVDEPLYDVDDPFGAVKAFGRLYLAEKELQARLDETQRKRGRLEPVAAEQLRAAELARAPLSTGATVFFETTLWAKAARVDPDDPKSKPDHPRAAAALRDAGLDEYLEETFNVQSLSAYFRRELEQAREERVEELKAQGVSEADAQLLAADQVQPEHVIPPALEGAVEVAAVTKLKANRGG